MKNLKFKVLAGVLALAALSTTQASAFNLGGLSRKAPVKIEKYASPTRAPLQYMMFCLSERKHCRGSGRKTVAYSKGLVSKLQRVNSKVNRSIRPKNERKDIWSIGVRSGDCEDFALTKRRDLIRAGVPAGALRMAVVKTGGGRGHAVLVVKTNKGDLVLDNRRSRVVAAHKSGYRFLKMATNNPTRWERINNSKYYRASKTLSRKI